MTLAEIKAKYNKESFNLDYFETKDKVKTKWLREWENHTRTAFLVHQDILDYIKENPDATNLHPAETAKQTDKGPMLTVVISKHKKADVVL
jgi:hypothetical protein